MQKQSVNFGSIALVVKTHLVYQSMHNCPHYLTFIASRLGYSPVAFDWNQVNEDKPFRNNGLWEHSDNHRNRSFARISNFVYLKSIFRRILQYALAWTWTPTHLQSRWYYLSQVKTVTTLIIDDHSSGYRSDLYLTQIWFMSDSQSIIFCWVVCWFESFPGKLLELWVNLNLIS